MWILPLVGYAGVLLGFAFLTLAIASGLYYLSELVEEHTVLARKLLTRLMYFVVGTQILLALVDQFPILLTLLSIASHGVYMGNLRHFPIVKLSDPVFIFSCVLVLVNHFLWFRHFSTPPSRPSSSSSSSSSFLMYEPIDIPTFTEIASYFGICIWLVPFALFVSLSAGENVLPTMGSEYATGGSAGSLDDSVLSGRGDSRGRRKRGLVKAAVDRTGEWLRKTGELMGFWRSNKTRSF